ncbi:MAG TPA: hypothetical protein EYG98_01410 [Sulfurovum sp.]|nr:hypothetical protein [Sulfurovum sp.]
MSVSYGARDISRNPSLLRIDANEEFTIEDKKSHKKLGVYIGMGLAEEFFAYKKKKELLDAANKIKQSAKAEYNSIEGTLNDGL